MGLQDKSSLLRPAVWSGSDFAGELCQELCQERLLVQEQMQVLVMLPPQVLRAASRSELWRLVAGSPKQAKAPLLS